MEKKRRKKYKEIGLVDKDMNIDSFKLISDLKSKECKCGITSKLYKLRKEYGVGFFELYKFEGLKVGIFDLQFKKDLSVIWNIEESFMELSFLIEGEQIMKVEGYEGDVVLENNECYLIYVSKIKGCINYHKDNHVKELKIRMSSDFIKRHKLDEEFNILNKYRFPKLNNTSYQKPICTKTQNIVFEIFENKQVGLFKRLFLESKVLELVTVQLSHDHEINLKRNNQSNKTVKKLYEVQHLISSNLTKQYTIRELSKHIGVNDFVLKKEFKRVFHKTTFEYATELRMKKAKELLLHTKKPVYEISELVGYKNSTHFTAAFKKIEGITPKKFRSLNI